MINLYEERQKKKIANSQSEKKNKQKKQEGRRGRNVRLTNARV